MNLPEIGIIANGTPLARDFSHPGGIDGEEPPRVNCSVMLEIYILRHGETVWNAEGRIQGHGDSALTPAGHEQAEAAGRALSGRNISALYCSSLGRAQATAGIIARHLGILPQPCSELRECAWGEWEGMFWKDLHQNFGRQMQRRKANRYGFRPPGGESYRDVECRAHPFVEEIRRTHPGGVIALVAHAMINRVLVRLLLGISFYEMLQLQQDDRPIYHVHVDGRKRRLRLIDIL